MVFFISQENCMLENLEKLQEVLDFLYKEVRFIHQFLIIRILLFLFFFFQSPLLYCGLYQCSSDLEHTSHQLQSSGCIYWQ